MPREHYNVHTYRARDSVGYLVKRLNSLMLPQIEALFANEELTFSQWCALIGLRDGVVATCADIARHLGHDTGATTRMVDQLEARGYLTRRRSRDDRRVVDLQLTPAGRKVVGSLAPHIVDFWNAMLDEYAPDEFEALIALLKRLLERVEQHVETAVPAPRQAAR